MAIRMKSTTVLLSDGKRVSWFNVNCTLAEKTKDGYQFTVFWKYKAAVKKEVLLSTMTVSEINKYFEKFGLVAFNDYYVNLSKILIVTEDQLYGPVEKTKIRMVFIDGYEILVTMESTKWSWWKQTFM